MSEDPPTDPPPAVATQRSAAAGTSSVGLPADIVAAVEQEHAVADLQASLKSREAEYEQLKREKEAVISERDAACECA